MSNVRATASLFMAKIFSVYLLPSNILLVCLVSGVCFYLLNSSHINSDITVHQKHISEILE